MTKSARSQNPVAPSAEGLAASARAASKGGRPPVHLWNPPFCGDLDIVIKRDGTWLYQGTPIGRAPLVKLFSSILRREGDAYFLVTPAEKVGITVEDAPFVAVDVVADGTGQMMALTFETQVGEIVTADARHPIRLVRAAATEEPAPYVEVRDGLEALIDRKTFYRLVDLGCVAPHDGADWFGLWSRGEFFPLQRAADLPAAADF